MSAPIGETPGPRSRAFVAWTLAYGKWLWIAALLLDWFAKNHLPDFPFKPQSFFHFGLGHLLLGMGVALLAALTGAFFPARAAARLDPAKALSE